MLDKKKRPGLTDEQRKRIMETPGVIVHRREGPPTNPVFEPKIRVNAPIPVRELLGRDDDYYDDDVTE